MATSKSFNHLENLAKSYKTHRINNIINQNRISVYSNTLKVYNYDLDSIGYKIKKFRIQNNLSQQQLAQEIGICPQVIGKYENNMLNYRKTTMDILTKLSERMQMKLDELLDPYFLFIQNYYGKYGDIIKQYRTKFNLTQVKLAKLIDVSENTIRSWEKNKNKPSHKMWELIKPYLVNGVISFE